MKATIKKIIRITGRIALWLLAFLLLVFLLVFIVWKVPAVHNYAVRKGTTYFNDKTQGNLSIEKVDLKLPFYIGIEGIELKGPATNDIVSVGQLEVYPGWRALFQKTILLDDVALSDVKMTYNVDSKRKTNLDFITEAFVDTSKSTPIDSMGTPWDFQLGKLSLDNIKFQYLDSSRSNSIRLKLGSLELETTAFSVNENLYEFGDISLSEIKLKAKISTGRDNQEKESNNSSTVGLPKIGLEKIQIDELAASVQINEDSPYVLNADQLLLESETIDLNEREFIISKVELNSVYSFIPYTKPSEKTTDPGPPKNTDYFPPIDFQLAELRSNEIQLELEDSTGTSRIFDANFNIGETVVNSQKIKTTVQEIVLRTEGIPELNAGFEVNLEPTRFGLNNLFIKGERSSVVISTEVKYTGIDKLINQQEFTLLNLELKKLHLDKQEVNQSLLGLGLDSLPSIASDIYGDLSLSGNSDRVDIQEITLRSGNTLLSLEGSIAAQDNWQSDVRIHSLIIDADREDLNPYLNFFDLDSALVPSKFDIEASGRYARESTNLKFNLDSELGKILINSSGKGWQSDFDSIQADIFSDSLNIGEYLSLETDFTTSLEMEIDLFHPLTDSIKLCTDLRIDSLQYDQTELRNIDLNADLIDSLLTYSLTVNDSFLLADLVGLIELNEGIELTSTGQIKGMDLYGLKVTEEDLRGKLGLNLSLKSDSNHLFVETGLDNILFVKDADRFPLEPISGSYFESVDSTVIDFHAEIIDLHSYSNRSLDSLGLVITEILSRGSTEVKDTSAVWIADFEVFESENFAEVFLPDLKSLEPAKGSARFSSEKRELLLDVNLPHVEYGNFRVDSLSINTNKSGNELQRNLHIVELGYDSLSVTAINLDFNRTPIGSEVLLTINQEDSLSSYDIGFDFKTDSLAEELTRVMSLRDEIILKGESWKGNDDFEVRFSEGQLYTKNAQISNGAKTLGISKKDANSPLTINAKDFELAYISGIINTAKPILDGVFNGDIELNRKGSFSGEGAINEIRLGKAMLGELNYEASRYDGIYTASIQASGGFWNFDLDGSIIPETETQSKLDLRMDISEINLAPLKDIIPQTFTTSEGILTGSIVIKGNTNDPDIRGDFEPKSIRLGLTNSRTDYRISGEEVLVTSDLIRLKKLLILDDGNNELKVNGEIKHDLFSNFDQNLTVVANDFALLDLKKSAGSPLYGKLISDLNLKIKGDFLSPDVEADLRIDSQTDLTYIVTSTTEREAFDQTLLTWTEFDEVNEDEILTGRRETVQKGIVFRNNPRINGVLDVDELAKFRVIVDSIAGDYLEVQGGGKLGISYDRTGSLRFSGNYRVKRGFYQMTFYDLIRKRFDFREGSKLTWNGDPTDGLIDFTAEYRTRAGVANLMMTEPGATYNDAFKQQLPFVIDMNIAGSLTDPEIFFGIRLEEGSEGALSGSVESRLQQIEQNENELNKQVFALLVLNSFIPQSNASDANILTNQARNSASQLLTNQLNSLSDKYIQGVNINFDLYSYGGEAGQGSTDLTVNVEKNFFEDRMLVRVGSTLALEENGSNAAQASNQQLLTNVEVEYKVTPDGRYRLLVFSKTDLEDIVVGRITRSGGGIVFQRDFDRFRYLFTPKEEEEEEDE